MNNENEDFFFLCRLVFGNFSGGSLIRVEKYGKLLRIQCLILKGSSAISFFLTAFLREDDGIHQEKNAKKDTKNLFCYIFGEMAQEWFQLYVHSIKTHQEHVLYHSHFIINLITRYLTGILKLFFMITFSNEAAIQYR